MRDVRVLPAHELRTGLDDRHFGAEAAVSLRQFETGITAADHDEVRRQNVELENLDMGQRLCRLEAGHAGNKRVGSDIEEDPIADERSHAAVVQAHLERLRPDETPAPHDQFGAARLIVLQMRGDLRGDHLALALANLRHVDLDRPGDHAEFGRMAREMSDLGASNLVLARQAGDVGAGAADPPPLDDRGSPP